MAQGCCLRAWTKRLVHCTAFAPGERNWSRRPNGMAGAEHSICSRRASLIGPGNRMEMAAFAPGERCKKLYFGSGGLMKRLMRDTSLLPENVIRELS